MAHGTTAAAPCVAAERCEIGALPVEERVTIILASVLFFMAVMVAGWTFLDRYPFFNSKPLSLRADLASRVQSSVHSIILIPGLLYGLCVMPWGGHYEPLGDVSTLQAFLLFSMGYFLWDLATTLYFRVPQWPVYAAHHVAAMTPYMVYLFVPACPVGLYVLSCFLLVEFTNVTLNCQTYLEQSGHGASRWYALCFYITFFGWIVVRVYIPLYLLYVIHGYVYPSIPSKGCMAFSIVCAYFIAVFCIGVFFGVLIPEMRNRWRAQPSVTEVVSDPLEAKALKVNPDLPLTPEELQLTVQSPTRIALYDARSFEHAVIDEIRQHTTPNRDPEAQVLRVRSTTGSQPPAYT